MQKDWLDAEADTVLLVRAEAAGMVTGKQGGVAMEICTVSRCRTILRHDLELPPRAGEHDANMSSCQAAHMQALC